MKIAHVAALSLCNLFSNVAYAEEEFTFDASEFEKKSYELNGYFDLTYEYQKLDQNSAAYLLNFPNQSDRQSVDRTSGSLEITGKYTKDAFSGVATFHSTYMHDYLGDDTQTDLYEGFVRYQPSTQLTAEIGKRTFRWGKGYAWNPVGFIERPKDPNDPDLSREGYVVAAVDYIKTYASDLHTIALTPVLLPVTEDINSDYGTVDKYNAALKIYFLYKNTDIDLLALSDGSRSARYGLDFSRNISTNFEVHGEWAYISYVKKNIMSSSGEIQVEDSAANQLMAGLRYLTENDTTYLFEFYYNGVGYSHAQLTEFYQGVKSANSNSDEFLLEKFKTYGISGYLQRNPGKQYFYLRASNKEPFDILYFTPALSITEQK